MSTIYIGERQSGKTTMLIEISEKTGATIVVATLSDGQVHSVTRCPDW